MLSARSVSLPRTHPALPAALLIICATMLSFAVAPRPAIAQTPTPSESPLTSNRPVLGILGFTAPENRGVTVARVLPDSGADEGGLEAGDLIVDVEGTKVGTMDDLATTIERFKVGDEITITYERNGESRTVDVELGSNRQSRRPPFEAIPEVPSFPDRPEAPEAPPPASGTDYRPVITLFGLLITGALIALTVVLARKDRPATEPPVQTAAYVPPVVAAARADPLEVLRLRYAKGEISREEFLTMSADLNGTPATPPSESPTQEL